MNRDNKLKLPIYDMRNQINWMKIILILFKITNFFKLTKIECSELCSQVNYMDKSFKKLNNILEQFNNIFISKGWVAYGALDLSLMESCINKAKEYDEDEAEKLLFAHYTNEYIEENLLRMLFQLPAVKLRENLLKLCYEDYINKRYHACIPVLLSIIDGIVCDVVPEQKSGANTNFDVWNSLCHKNGVDVLYKNVIHKTRRKTTTEKISLPYRNGILHGRDLGYANYEVAVKTWNLFFAICSWANEKKSELWKLKECREKHENDDKSILDILQEYSQHKDKMDEINNCIAQWKPRCFKETKFPINVLTTDFEINTPEYILKSILIFWQRKQYGKIASFVMDFSDKSNNKLAGEIRKELEYKEIVDAQITNIIDESPAITEITVDIQYKVKEKLKSISNYKIRLLCRDQKGNPITRNYEDSDIIWNFIPTFIYNLV